MVVIDCLYADCCCLWRGLLIWVLLVIFACLVGLVGVLCGWLAVDLQAVCCPGFHCWLFGHFRYFAWWLIGGFTESLIGVG